MPLKEKKTALFMLILLMFSAVSCSFAGFLVESSLPVAAKIQSAPQNQEDEGGFFEDVPCIPCSAFRFSLRQQRNVQASTGRVRSWTPADLVRHEELEKKINFPHISFRQIEEVMCQCAENTITTSPVRAGPERYFLFT